MQSAECRVPGFILHSSFFILHLGTPPPNRTPLLKRASGNTLPLMKPNGMVYLVGAGPGDAGLLTLRGAELLRRADVGVPFEVVPGVSSFVAVPNYAGVPLTHRDFCSKLTLITGHEDPAKEASSIDWPQVARTPGTKVIMMGTDRIGQIAEMLTSHGMDAATPVAMVRWGTTGHQQSIEGTLATISEIAAREKIGPPTVAVIGEVVKLRKKLNWFERRQLFGQRIVVTRGREQAALLSRRLRDLGAEVLEISTIKTEAPSRREDLVDALLELNAYDWLVFTSPNGVTTFFEYFFRRFHDMRDLGG